MRRLILLLLVCPAACRDSNEPDQPLDRVCDLDGPVPLLDVPQDAWMIADPIPGTHDLLVQETSDGPLREVVVDDCGGRHVDVVSAVTWIRRWGDVMLACGDPDGPPFQLDGMELWVLSGYDDPTPERLAGSCLFHDFGDVGLSVDEDPNGQSGRLLELRRDGHSITTDVLTDQLAPFGAPVGWNTYRVDDRWFAQMVDGTIRSYDPDAADWRVELEAPASEWFIDAHRLIYETPSTNDPDLRTLRVRDLDSGTDVRLANDIDPEVHLGVPSQGVVTVGVDPPTPESRLRWFLLDEGREVIPPADTQILLARDDGSAWLFRRHDAESPEDLLFWQPGTEPRLVATDSHFWLVYAGPDFIVAGTRIARDGYSAIVRIDDGGGPPVALGELSGGRMWIGPEGRMLTVLAKGVDGYYIGPLVLLDPDGASPRTILPRVQWDAPLLSRHFGTFEDILYRSEPQSGRSTLYRARWR